MARDYTDQEVLCK